MEEVKNISSSLASKKLHPKNVKMDLAQQVVEMYHGRALAEAARESFVQTFQHKEIPEDIEEISIKKDTMLVDVLVFSTIVSSKSEARRLIREGAIRKDGEEKIHDEQLKVEQTLILRIGKHRFIKIIPS
jgi:tyrosyl-tRNA synthetase